MLYTLKRQQRYIYLAQTTNKTASKKLQPVRAGMRLCREYCLLRVSLFATLCSVDAHLHVAQGSVHCLHKRLNQADRYNKKKNRQDQIDDMLPGLAAYV